VADLLGTTTAAVNSMLQRARAQISQAAPDEEAVNEPGTAAQRQLLDRYVAAFEKYDVAALVTLFSDDVVWEMPPFTGWYQSPQSVGRLIATQCPATGPGDLRMIEVRANGQPGFGMYMRDGGEYRAFQLHVLHVTASAVDHVTAFFDTSLFAVFGLPATIPGQEQR